MGDRCYLQFTLLKKDTDKWGKIFGVNRNPTDWKEWSDEQEETERALTLTFYEANYAFDDELKKLAKGKVPFYGFHGDGGNYGPGRFCSSGNGQFYWFATYSGQLCISIESGQPTRKALAESKVYIKMEEKAQKLIHGK